MASFNQTLRPTPFGLYDADPLFQKDADAMVVFVLRKLGEDTLSVELTKKQIWACFEEATREFNGMIIEYQAQSNLANILGTSSGSVNTTTGQNTINLTNVYVPQNLDFIDTQAEAYANIIGYGQTQNTFTGSIQLQNGVQDYDLYTQLVDESGNPLFNTVNPSGGKMRIYEVYHFAPVQYVFNSNLASNFIAHGLPVESYIPDTRFYVLPLFEDVLRAGLLKTAQRVRRSNYSYMISGRKLRIFPIPNNIISGFNDKLWVRVGFPTPLDIISGSFINNSGSYNANVIPSTANTYFGVSTPANAPFGLINYSTLNQWAKNWIAQYTLALCKELLGYVRRKVKSIPIPNATVELDGDEFVNQAKEEKENLKNQLKEKLESLTYAKLQEQEAAKAENLMKQLSAIPIPPTHAIKMW